MISADLKKKIAKLRICRKCSAIGKNLFFLKRLRCPLCGKATRKYKLKGMNDQEVVENVKNEGGDKKIIKLITARCADFDCPGEITSVIKGPVVTEYEFKPDRFTRVRRLKALDQDLTLALAADAVTIRTIPGKPCMGISIPNGVHEVVTFDSCADNIKEHYKDMELPLNFGITSDGSPYVEDLARYPHMLIAGTTGTGKSVLLNQLLTNLLTVRSPEQLKLILIDPKTVELFPYAKVPHLMRAPVAQVWTAIQVMEDVINEMKNRTQVLHNYQVTSIKELNDQFKSRAAVLEKEGKRESAALERAKCWPYILVVIDEMANLVLEQKKDFIARMASIAQMARAAGISVIAATQRPSVDVLPGKIKVNFLARGAFRMPSAADSKTVLNFKGAETLLGKGDMFMLSPDKTGLQRIHVAHCKKENRDVVLERIAKYGYNSKGLLMESERKLVAV